MPLKPSRHSSDHRERAMNQHFSSNVSPFYISAKKCMACTENVCTGTIPAGTVQPTALLLDARARVVISFTHTLLALICFSLPTMSSSELNNCFAYTHTYVCIAPWKDEESFSQPTSLWCCCSSKNASGDAKVPVQLASNSFPCLQDLDPTFIIDFAYFFSGTSVKVFP